MDGSYKILFLKLLSQKRFYSRYFDIICAIWTVRDENSVQIFRLIFKENVFSLKLLLNLFYLKLTSLRIRMS